MTPSTIGAINLLPEPEKRAIYSRHIPASLLEHLGLPPSDSAKVQTLLEFTFPEGSSAVEMALFHEAGFPDPVLYTHLTDTLNGQIHVLLYILNDPASPRFGVDRLLDGTPTKFGTLHRNVSAEHSALEAGLAPGQVRRGLRMLGPAISSFEEFVRSLGQQLYFVEPLHYHNAVIFEHYGFSYQLGRTMMDKIHTGFRSGGELARKLSPENAFRRPESEGSVRLRSWAVHDGILGEPFSDVTMYKRIGQASGIDTAPGVRW